MLTSIYKSVIRPLLFKFDPETAHAMALKVAHSKVAEYLSGLLPNCTSEKLKVSAMGLKFRNPVGIAAGVDKDCLAPGFFGNCGFSHIEIGTVTMVPQEGNPRPRLFRYPELEGLVNRMGFPNDGIERVLQRLIEFNKNKTSSSPIVGVNIGKSKVTSIDDAHNDYRELFRLVKNYCDYVAVNVSSPNTPDLRKLQEKGRLRELFDSLNEIAGDSSSPIIVKVAPDLTINELDEILEVIIEKKISGIVASNTLIDRSGLPEYVEKVGGFSGTPILKRTLEFIRHISREVKSDNPDFVVIACGGISTADHARQVMEEGADLVQLYTGLVYEGPFVVRDICKGLESSVIPERLAAEQDATVTSATAS